MNLNFFHYSIPYNDSAIRAVYKDGDWWYSIFDICRELGADLDKEVVMLSDHPMMPDQIKVFSVEGEDGPLNMEFISRMMALGWVPNAKRAEGIGFPAVDKLLKTFTDPLLYDPELRSRLN